MYQYVLFLGRLLDEILDLILDLILKIFIGGVLGNFFSGLSGLLLARRTRAGSRGAGTVFVSEE